MNRNQVPCGEIEFGECPICKKKEQLFRTYFRYPGVKCTCHGPEHFEFKIHCANCVPAEPEYSKVEFRTEDLKNPAVVAIPMLKEALLCSQDPGSYYSVWKSSIAMAIIDTMPEKNEEIYELANKAAVLFLERLVQ